MQGCGARGDFEATRPLPPRAAPSARIDMEVGIFDHLPDGGQKSAGGLADAPPCRCMIEAMASDETAAHRRGEARASPIRVFRLGEEPGDDLSGRTTPEERIAMMWPLAVDAWTSAGRRLPQYSRDRMPGRIIRPPAPEAMPRAAEFDFG